MLPKINKYVCLILGIGISLTLSAQHSSTHPDNDSLTVPAKNCSQGITLLYGSIFIPESNENGEDIGHALVPSLSIDYEIWYKHKVGILLLNEFVLSSYTVNDANGHRLERESILITAIGIGYSPFTHFGLYAGGGLEIDLANGNNFSVIRVGAEYGIPIRNNWVSVIALAGDFRKEYVSGSFEFGFAKTF